jgi:hypothetical protein
LRRLFRTDDSYYRLQATRALWRIDRDTNPIPVLIGEVEQDIEPDCPPPLVSAVFTCQLCFEAFVEIGPEAKAASVIFDALRCIANMERLGVPLTAILRLTQEALLKVDSNGTAGTNGLLQTDGSDQPRAG